MHYKIPRFVARLLSTAAAAGIILGASPAMAQGTATDDDSDTQEPLGNEIIVVGVTKQASAAQDTPIAITAFSGEDLATQGVLQVKEIAAFTPGFNVRDAGNNPTAFVLAIRGQVQNDNIATLDPSVGVYMDEFYIARAYGLNTNLLDVENAQVLKGPQGTLFGRNTSAGAVLFTTADPKFGEVSGRAEALYGRFNEHQLTGIVNLGGEKVAVRAALFYANRDGYQTDVNTGRDWGAYRTINGRIKVAIKPVEDFTILLSAEQWDSKIDGRVNQNLFFRPAGFAIDPAATDRANFGGDPDRVAVTNPSAIPGTPLQGPNTNTFTETYMAKFILETSFGEVRLINGYRRVESNSLLDLDGASSTSFYHFTEATNDLEQWSTELQVTGSAFDDKLSFAAGAIYFGEQGFDQSTTNQSAGAPSPVWTQFRGEIDNTSFGLYAQGTYALTDKLNLTLGGRWTHDEKGVTVQSAVRPVLGPAVACLPLASTGDNNRDGTFTAEDCNRSRSDTWSSFDYTVILDYDISDDVMVYAKHSTGFRAGAQQLRSLTLADTTPAEPEQVTEQEVGLKSAFLSGKLQFNISGYHTKVKDAQRSVILNVGGVPQTILENADVEIWGFEADFNLRVAPGLDVFGGYAHTDPSYERYDGFAVVNGVLSPFDKSDYGFNSVVRNQFNIGANYRTDLGFARLNLNASYAWQDEMLQVDAPIRVLTLPAIQGGSGLANVADAELLKELATTRSFGITNTRASLAFGPDDNYEVAIWGRNIFDERAITYNLFVQGLNYLGAAWNDPATYGVSVGVKF